MTIVFFLLDLFLSLTKYILFCIIIISPENRERAQQNKQEGTKTKTKNNRYM